MYLLDTDVVSERRKPRLHGGVVAWLQSTADADLHLSAVTLGEIQAGIELAREQDAAKAVEIEAWLELVAQAYNVMPMGRLCPLSPPDHHDLHLGRRSIAECAQDRVDASLIPRPLGLEPLDHVLVNSQ